MMVNQALKLLRIHHKLSYQVTRTLCCTMKEIKYIRKLCILYLCYVYLCFIGMNTFLRQLNITFRRDPTNFRPRLVLYFSTIFVSDAIIDYVGHVDVSINSLLPTVL